MGRRRRKKMEKDDNYMKTNQEYNLLLLVTRVIVFEVDQSLFLLIVTVGIVTVDKEEDVDSNQCSDEGVGHWVLIGSEHR